MPSVMTTKAETLFPRIFKPVNTRLVGGAPLLTRRRKEPMKHIRMLLPSFHSSLLTLLTIAGRWLSLLGNDEIETEPDAANGGAEGARESLDQQRQDDSCKAKNVCRLRGIKERQRGSL